MNQTIKKSVLSDFVSRHSMFNSDEYIATTPSCDYDVWNGFCLPMHFSNVLDEYQAIRHNCAMFDASPMKKYCFRGTDAGAFLDRVLTAPVSQLAPMHSAYGLICDERGLLIDDGIVNKFSEDDYSLFISELDLDDHFAKYNDFNDLRITIETELQAGLALQGPKSCAVLAHFGFDAVEMLAPFELKHFQLGSHNILLGRLGFTGDLGYEIWFPPAAITAVAQAFADAEAALGFIVPGYGLSALQICRIEAGMIVPGWDTAGEFSNLDKERSPYELTLGWNVKLDRDLPFAGKDALTLCKQEGPRFRMKGVSVVEKCDLVEGQMLFAIIAGQTYLVGTLPSIVWHVVQQQWIGFASIKAEHADIERAFVVVNGMEIKCQIRPLPFINLPQRAAVPATL
ncbi:MAG: aminomethyltransferase [Oceanicoccus sp.]|jgi:aminomethyltransferase